MTVRSIGRDIAFGLLRGTPLATGRVRQVEVPAAGRALCTLAHIDYEDAFLAEVGPVEERTAEQWARAILEDAPSATRRALRRAWSTLGLQLGPTRSDAFVLGWELRRSTPDFVLLGADGSRLGLSAELLVKSRGAKLLFDTFVQKENRLARAIWAGVELVHPRVVRQLLEEAGRREQRRRQPAEDLAA